jgi:RNA polymerase-binding transcription factor DksA
VFDSERALETSVAVAAIRQDAAIAQIRAGLAAEGADDCVECGAEIGAARRAALPSAIRCVGCQARVERGGK